MFGSFFDLQPLSKKDKERELKKRNAELLSKMESLEKKCAVLEVIASLACFAPVCIFGNYRLVNWDLLKYHCNTAWKEILMLLGVTCILVFLILKFLNKLKGFWLSIQVTNRLYCFNVCNFCHPRTIWNFCDFSWRLKLSGVKCTEFRVYGPFLHFCA